MIRDEFLKNDKGLTPKEIQGIKEQGERAYYSSQIMNLTNMNKTFNFSLLVIFFLSIVATGILVYVLISKVVEIDATIIGVMIADGVMLLCLAGWFFIGRPIVNKKIKRYKGFMEEYNQKELRKNKQIYLNLK